ncbi:hypothetical protein MBRA1_003526 [Malassezia brasiliensis]|uniref:Rho-GAP domain-containing protein n=1 Tax=Malassezia brasiliensis TaxID=1821822 RepID=A0AAF0DWL4_9BASI|nr:hypothetical protein MBRA1_003526 [Malassezia brasiliensis]
MPESRSGEPSAGRQELRDTAPVARLPLQKLTLADCYAHVGTQDPSIVLPFLLLQYNDLVGEHLALSHTYHTHMETAAERPTVAEPVGLGMEGVSMSPPTSSRFRLLRRRSARSARETAQPGHGKGSGSTGTASISVTSPSSTEMTLSPPSDTAPIDMPRRDLFGSAVPVPRSGVPPRATPEPKPVTTVPIVTQSPSLWRKSSLASSPRSQDTAQQTERSARAPAYAVSPRAHHAGSTSTLLIPPSPGRGAARTADSAVPSSPSVRRGDGTSPMAMDRDSLCRAAVHVVHSHVQSRGQVAMRLRVQPVAGDDASVYMIEKAYADYVQVSERLRVRAQSLADTQTALLAPPPDVDLFERHWTPWRVAERNALVDAWVAALQRLPASYADVVVQFLSTNVVVDLAPTDAAPTLGPSLRQAHLLTKRVHSSEWEWRVCSLHPHMLYLQALGNSAPPLFVRLPHARIRRLYEDAPHTRLGHMGPRCAMIVVQPVGGSRVTLATESSEECSAWLQALLLQSHEAQDPIRRPFSTPEPAPRSHDVPSTPRNEPWSSPVDRADSTSPVLGLERTRHGLTGLFRTNLTPEQPTPSGDKRRFWHGLLGMGQGHGSPEGPAAHAGDAGMFGAPLHTAVSESGLAVDPTGQMSPVPAIVRRCVDYLEHTRGIEEEGIYRVSGSSSAIKALYDSFSTMRDVDLEADGAQIRSLTSDPHNLSCLLKMYLRALPENLCASRLADMAQAAELPDRTERAAALAQLVAQLPPENYSLLRYLCAHFNRVEAAADKNKMNAHNLGIVLSPTLAMPASLLLALLVDFDVIFARSPRSEASPFDHNATPESDAPTPLLAQVELNRERIHSLSLRSPHSRPDPPTHAAADRSALAMPPHSPLAGGEARAP